MVSYNWIKMSKVWCVLRGEVTRIMIFVSLKFLFVP